MFADFGSTDIYHMVVKGHIEVVPAGGLIDRLQKPTSTKQQQPTTKKRT